MDKKPLLNKAEVLSRVEAKRLIENPVYRDGRSKKEAEDLLWEATKAGFRDRFIFVE